LNEIKKNKLFVFFFLKHTDSIENGKRYIYCLFKVEDEAKKRNNIAMNLLIVARCFAFHSLI